jgi:hypothetical protein
LQQWRLARQFYQQMARRAIDPGAGDRKIEVTIKLRDTMACDRDQLHLRRQGRIPMVLRELAVPFVSLLQSP